MKKVLLKNQTNMVEKKIQMSMAKKVKTKTLVIPVLNLLLGQTQI